MIYCKKNQVSIFYIVCTTELRKRYVFRGGGVAGHWASTVIWKENIRGTFDFFSVIWKIYICYHKPDGRKWRDWREYIYRCYRRNGSVRRIRSAWPKSQGEMEPGMDTTFRPNIWKTNMFVFPFNFFAVLLKMHFSDRTVFQSERVLNIFDMVMKTQFYTNVWRANMV